MTWLQFFDRTENTLRRWDVFVGEIFTERFKAQLSIDCGMLEQGFDLGGEDKLVFFKTVMQGLFAQSVPRKKQAFFSFHPREQRQTFRSGDSDMQSRVPHKDAQ